jgi:hypothetical protein
MTAAELIRLVRRRGVEVGVVAQRGTASHGMSSHGSGKMVRKDARKRWAAVSRSAGDLVAPARRAHLRDDGVLALAVPRLWRSP